MSNRQPNHGVVTNVTSDGQGHYVVFHQQDAQSPPVQVQHQQQRLTSAQMLPPSLVLSNTSGFAPLRPRILTRPATISGNTIGQTPPTTFTVTARKSASLRTPAPGVPTTPSMPPQQQQQSIMHTPQVVTILDDEPSANNFSVVTSVEQTLPNVNIYADSRSTQNDPILTPGSVNYTTLTSMDNFQSQVNNIYMEAVPSNLDPSSGTVIMGSDNQLYNIQNNGEAVLYCPSSVTGDGPINLLPLIEANNGVSSNQIHFPIGDVMTGNGVFELIALPNDSSITSFTDQPILNLANTSSYGTMIPISQQQQDPSTQYVFSVTDENGVETVSSVGVVQQNSTPLSVDNSSVLTFSVPSSSVTTMAPSVSVVQGLSDTNSIPSQQSKSQRTYITVVDDFSDLIKTEGGGDGNAAWGYVGNLDEEQGLSFGMGTSRADTDESDSSQYDAEEDSKDSITEIIDDGRIEDSNVTKVTFSGISTNDFYEQIETDYVEEDQKVESMRVMVDGEYFEEVKPTSENVRIIDPTQIKLDSTTIKKISQLTPITLQGNQFQQLKIGTSKGSIQIGGRTISALTRKPSEAVSTIVAKNLNDFTTITLRNTMEKVNSEHVPMPIVVEKPKPKVSASQPTNRPGMRGPAIPLVDWVNGVGRFPGLAGKICVDDSTGTLEVLDYNPEEHQRKIRVPLKIVKEQPKVTKKIDASAGKASNPLKTTGLKAEQLKVKEKRILPPDVAGDEANFPLDDRLENSSSEKHPAADVTFCVNCGTLANKDFIGRRCKKCFEAADEAEISDNSNESTAAKFKIPKGITIVKTSKRLHSPAESKAKRPMRTIKQENDDSEQSVLRNQSPLLKFEPPVDSTGITVIPIFQTPSLSSKSETEEDEVKSTSHTSAKRRKYRRSLIEQRKLKAKSKTSGGEKVATRKRTFEKVLKTKTSHAKRSLLGSGSSVSDSRSPGPEELSDSDVSGSKTPCDSRSDSPEAKKTPLIDFNWSKYLQESNSKGAPPRFFRQPAFPSSNPFKIGMMLEAVDPQHQSLFCVANVVDTQGYRIRLHLTGYSDSFDFWVNADSYDIFPTGWCAANNHPLEAPPTYENFTWTEYLEKEGVLAADPEFFAISHEANVPATDIQVGMKLEAVDIRNMSLTCVATVQNIINDRLLIHFDSWDCIYDYWTDTSSPFIHPVGYCKKNTIELTPPKNHRGPFIWENYLKETSSVPVPSQSIRPLPPIGFKKGMKLECVDKRNPFLIRVATIAEVEDHQLLIHFDGWSSDYDFYVYECSGDIHPVGWCAATGHPLQVPPDDSEPWSGSCSVFGCLGMGHIKGYRFMTHNAEFNCPYSPGNLKKDFTDSLPDRFLSYKKSVIVTQQHENSNLSRRSSTSMEPQTTFARAAKLRSEKRKALAAETPVTPAKRKYTKRKTEAEILLKAKGNSSSDGESKDKKGSLLLRRLSARQSNAKAGTTVAENLPVTVTKALPPPIKIEPVVTSVVTSTSPTTELPKRIVLPNIESTITPVLPPSTLPGGATVQVHWEDLLDSMKEKKSVVEGVFEAGAPPPAEFTLPSSTTMTPIPTPGNSTGVVESFQGNIKSSSADHLLMICSQKAGGELTISQCSNDSLNGEGGGGKSQSTDQESDLPVNYAQNIKFLQGVVGKLNTPSVSKWRTKNVSGFVRKIPGCLAASQKFDEHQIDGEAFLLMTMADFSEVMGLKMGPSIKIIQAIRLIHKNSLPAPLPAVSITPIPVSAL